METRRGWSEGGSVDDVSGTRTLGDKLNHLFAQVKPAPDKEYSNAQVAASINAHGVTISQSYIWQLRNSIKDNPTIRHLQGLAAHFGVPVSYFLDDSVTDRVDDDLEQLREQREKLMKLHNASDAQTIAMRAGELSQARRQQVIDLLNVVYELEKGERGEPTDLSDD